MLGVYVRLTNLFNVRSRHHTSWTALVSTLVPLVSAGSLGIRDPRGFLGVAYRGYRGTNP